MKVRERLWAIILFPLVLVACPYCGPTEVCTAEARAGLIVEVVDRLSGDALCDATVTASEGGYQETLLRQPGENADGGSTCVHVGAYERTGTYVLNATHATHQSGSVGQVRVEQDSCHVIAQRRTIVLERN